jgi:hypothetical protein
MRHRASQHHLKVIGSFCSIQGWLGKVIVVTDGQVRVQHCLKLLNFCCRVLNCAFDALEFIELIPNLAWHPKSYAIRGNPNKFAATQTNDAQLIYDIVGDAVDDRRLNLAIFLASFPAQSFWNRL